MLCTDIPFGVSEFMLIFGAMLSRSMRKYARNAGAALLLILFAGYWSSVTLFPHTHHIDGGVYVHSHPYSGPSNNPSHSHTAQQFQLIAHLSLLVLAAATLVAFALQLLGATFLYPTRKTARRQAAPIRVYGLRAPPAC